MLVPLSLTSFLFLWTMGSATEEQSKANLLAQKDAVGVMVKDMVDMVNKKRFEETKGKGDFVPVTIKEGQENVVKEILKDTIEQISDQAKKEAEEKDKQTGKKQNQEKKPNQEKNKSQEKNQVQEKTKQEEKNHQPHGKKKKDDDLAIPEDADHPEQMKTFKGLIQERRRIQRRMMFHIVSSFLVGTLTYFLRSNPILMYLFGFLDDKNENWGQNIEERWVDHQEKMADFVLGVIHKYGIDAKAAKGKKIHLEVDHNRYVTVPVYRTFPNDPLPENVKEINNNRVNLWKNLFTRR